MVEYYVQVDPSGSYQGTWVVKGRNAEIYSRKYGGLKASAIKGQNITSAIYQVLKTPPRQVINNNNPPYNHRLIRTELGVGEYYSRMARPIESDQAFNLVNPGKENPITAAEIATACQQTLGLAEKLSEICRVIHPSRGNLQSYGHEIRNLLILASTEVESFWAGVLNEHKVIPINKLFSTKDYVKLLPAMRLDEYAVRFMDYPWLPVFKPFEGWDANNSTKSLAWYTAYNSAKHNREKHFSAAKLKHVFNAIAACYVMMDAQYGYLQRSFGSSGIRVTEEPKWAPNECYITLNQMPFPGSLSNIKFKPVKYPF